MKNILQSALLKNSFFVYAGNITNAGLAFFASVLLARLLEPAGFGLFSTAVAILFLVNELTDLGINPSVIRYASMYIQRGDTNSAAQCFRFALKTRLSFALIFVGLGILSSSFIANRLLTTAEIQPLLLVAFLGVIPLMIQSYLSVIFQSEQRFKEHVVMALISGVSKIALVAVLLTTTYTSPITALICFSLSPIIAIAYGYFKTNKNLVVKVAKNTEVLRELKSFTFWMAIWATFAILHGKLDQLMVSSMLGSVEAGIFAAAYQFASIITFLVGAIGTVLNPKITNFTREQLLKFNQYFGTYFILLCLAVAGIGLLGNIFIPLLFGVAYQSAVGVFNALLIGCFVFGLAVFPNAILNALNKPFIFSITAAVGLIASFILNLIFLPRFGTVGAAYTFGIVNSVSLLISFLAARKYLLVR